MNMPAESSLFGRVRAGDRSALSELVGLYWRELRQWALWETGDLEVAEDACQETWLKLAGGGAASLDPGRNVAGWLRTLVRNTCRDLLARERRLHRPIPLPQQAAPAQEREIDVRRGAEKMFAAFARLTPRQREALDLVDRLGLAPQEAAERMGATPATVRALLHQGRHALRAHVHAELHDLVKDP